MTKALDPEIKALRAIERAIGPLDDQEVKRGLEWVIARRLRLPGYWLHGFPRRRAHNTGQSQDTKGDDG